MFEPTIKAENGSRSPDLNNFYAAYIRGRWGKGRSYDEGFQSFGCIGTILNIDPYQHLFFDTQLIQLDQNDCASSIGLGWRLLETANQSLFGFNVFYDFRYSNHHSFHEIGLGIEYFTSLFDLRLNGYLPLGSKKSIYDSWLFDYGDGDIIFIDELYNAMWGLDLEIGKCIRFCEGLWFYCGAGPYFYDTFENTDCCSHSLLGFSGRLTLNLLTNVQLDFLYTYDRIFKSCPQFQITFTIPFSCLHQRSLCPVFYVYRNPIITIKSTCQYRANF